MRALRILIGAVRGIRIARGNLAVAFTILTLAMTAGTVTFSVVDAVAFRRLPYADPEELVGISLPAERTGRFAPVTQNEFLLLQERAQAFTAIAASRPTQPVYFGDTNAAEPLATRAVTTNLFDVLGIRPVAGRLITTGDDRSSGPRVAVLSHELWLSRFDGRRDVIGSTVTFGTEPLHIVGVMPDDVWHPMELNPPAIYVPYVATPADRANTRLRAMSVVARLRADMSLQQAQADAARVVTGPIIVQPLKDVVVGTSRGWLLLLLAAVSLVLLIACVNVATLLLARATTRAREFAIRASLGESRVELIAGVLIESLLLSLAAGGIAIIASLWGVEAAKSVLPPGLVTRASTIAVDGRVIVMAIGIAAFCAAAFGAAPAWLTTRFNLFSVMGDGGGPIIGGRRIDRSLAGFLIAEVTVVCVLLVASTLVVRSFIEVLTTDLGFDRQNVATVPFMRGATATSDAALRIEGTTLRNELLAAAKTVPGVIDAAISVNGTVPLSGGSARYSLNIPGYGEALDDDMFETRIVTPEYFNVMGMQLITGRLLESGDHLGTPRVIVINEEAARRFFPGRNPVGQIVRFRTATTVVGVLRSVRFDGPEGEVRPEMYISAEQEHMPLSRLFGSVIVRTAGRPADIGHAVREAMRPVLGAEPGQVQLVDEFFVRLTAGRRFNATVMAVLGLIGVAIGIASVYATMQFIVTRRLREIGLRLALGASRQRIMRSVLGSAIRRVMAGVTLGLFASWMISSALQAVVFGVTPTEPGVYVQVTAALALFGLLAALLPALRAARLDPVETLRRE